MVSKKIVEIEKENPTFELPPIQKEKKKEEPKSDAPIANLKISNKISGNTKAKPISLFLIKK